MTSAVASSISMDRSESQTLLHSDTEDESPKKIDESSEDGDDGTDSEAKSAGAEPEKLREPISSADESEKTESEPEESTPKEEKKAEVVAKPKPAKKAPAERKRKAEAPVPPPTQKSNEFKAMGSPDDFVGALDASVAEQVKSDGFRRERKQVDRLSYKAPEKSEEKVSLTIVAGAGCKLADIPFVADQIQKKRGADLGHLYRLLFARKGAPHEIKKNLRQFSGFGYAKDSPEYLKKKTLVSKWDSRVLKEISEVLGTPKTGTKVELLDRILDFCIEPKDSGLQPKGKKSKGSPKKGSPRKSAGSPTKKKKPSAKKNVAKESDDESEKSGGGSEDDKGGSDDDFKTKTKSKVVKKKTSPPKRKKEKKERAPPTPGSRSGPSRQAASGKLYAENEDEDEFDDVVEPKKPKLSRSEPVKRARSDSESESPAEVDSEEERKKKKTKKSKAPEKKSSAAKPAPSTSKKEPVVKASKPKFTAPPPKKQKVESESNESEEESDHERKTEKKMENKTKDNGKEEKEVSTKKGSLPNDKDLKEAVTKVVSESDLRKVTMKMMLETIYALYPNVDLEPKKAFIKSIVKQLID